MKFRIGLVFILIVAAAFPVKAGIEEGLAAHWDFKEGSGEIIHDSTGNGNIGIIHGSNWIKNGTANALELDGIDDFVDCGTGASLDIRNSMSLAFWARFDPPIKDGEVGVVGKLNSSYLVSFLNGNIYPYAGTPTSISSPVDYGSWKQITVTYDRKYLRFFINGKLASERAFSNSMSSGKNFWIGKSDADPQWTKGAYWHGAITDLRVYNRALNSEEVSLLFHTTNVTGLVSLAPVVCSDKVMVEINSRGLGRNAGYNVKLELWKNGDSRKPLRKITVKSFDSDFNSIVSIPMQIPEAGLYEIRALPADTAGRSIGLSSGVEIKWPGYQKFPSGPLGARRLNNLVTELLKVSGKGSSGKTYSFTNPKNGWVYIANKGASEVTVMLEGSSPQKLSLPVEYNGAYETMRELPTGKYTISSKQVKDLVVRSVSDIVFCSYAVEPFQIKRYAKDKEENLRKYVYPHVNILNSQSDFPPNDPFIKEWRDRGGKWVIEQLHYLQKQPENPTVDNLYQYMVSMPGFNRPDSIGIFADEFGNAEPVTALYAQAFKRMKSEPMFKDKVLFAFGLEMTSKPEGLEFLDMLVETNGKFAPEMYLGDQPTEIAMWREINKNLTDRLIAIREKRAEYIPHVISVIGYSEAKSQSSDVCPQSNFKVHVDREYNIIATHPAAKDIGGVVSYLSSFSTPEMVRWGGKLFRHYAIEGKTEMLSKDPYILTHIDNSDFEEAGKSWTLSTATEGSIEFSSKDGLSWLQGRFPPVSWGNKVLVTKRGAERPNIFSQTIKDLVPGRLYSMEMINADYNDMAVQDIDGVSIKIDDVEMISDECFDEKYPNCFVHHYGPFNAEHRAWMNFHFRLFRAKKKTAMLKVSDWASETLPGGPIGQKMMYNFVQIQPWFTE